MRKPPKVSIDLMKPFNAVPTVQDIIFFTDRSSESAASSEEGVPGDNAVWYFDLNSCKSERQVSPVCYEYV